jgi:hypothetical protein
MTALQRILPATGAAVKCPDRGRGLRLLPNLSTLTTIWLEAIPTNIPLVREFRANCNMMGNMREFGRF